MKKLSLTFTKDNLFDMQFKNLNNNINICGLHSFRIDAEDNQASKMIIVVSKNTIEIANCSTLFVNKVAQIIFFTQLIPNENYQIDCKVIGNKGNILHHRNINVLVYNTNNTINNEVTKYLKNNGFPVLKAGRANMQYLEAQNNENLTAWFNQKKSASFLNIKNSATPQHQTLLNQFVNNGYAVIENLLSEDELREANANLEEAAENGFGGYTKGSSQKLYNLHLKYPIFSHFLRHPKIYEVLRFFFQSEPLACQSLTFVCGSQQIAHQDSSFLTAFPQGYMCGVWIALEDIQANSGELFYHKKSHLAERYITPVPVGDDQYKVGERIGNFKEAHNEAMEKAMEQYPEREFFRAKAGDALIWHEVLLHGGAKRMDEFTTRKSVVFHYYADGAIAMFDDRGVVPRLNNRYGLA